MDSQLRLDILRELLSCVDNLCAWRYDKEMILQSSNSKQAEFFDILFSISLCKQQALAHCTQNDTPILLTSTIGLTWIAAPEYEADELCHVYVIGPVFTANASERSILQMAQDMDISVSLRTSFLEQIKTVPIVMIPAFCRYGAMLHFCITGQKINAYDLLQAKSAGRVRRATARKAWHLDDRTAVASNGGRGKSELSNGFAGTASSWKSGNPGGEFFASEQE